MNLRYLVLALFLTPAWGTSVNVACANRLVLPPNFDAFHIPGAHFPYGDARRRELEEMRSVFAQSPQTIYKTKINTASIGLGDEFYASNEFDWTLETPDYPCANAPAR